jgi:cytochrome c-type biogenesis protein CcmE
MQSPAPVRRSQSKFKFLLGGLLIVAAVVYLIASSTQANAQYFLTVDELTARKVEMATKDVRISGAVVGDSIQYDSKTLTLRFTVVHIPGDNKVIDAQGGLAEVLHKAVEDKTAQRLNIVYNGVKPDLLKNEAQAIMTGKLNPDGTFTATELLLKCPTRYEEAVPAQSSEK